MRKFSYAFILVVSFGVVAVPAGASAPSTVSPPPTIIANCTKVVSYAMQHWLMSLPPNTTVVAPAGACYRIDGGITLAGAQGLTIAGGTWEDETVPVPGSSPTGMTPALWFQGGSNVTLENLTVSGSSPGGYTEAGAFGAGIRSDGVIGFRVTDVNVDNVWGDGLELTPLRGTNDTSGTIINPSENVSVYDLNVDGAGRQGVTLASVAGASLDDINLKRIGFDFFDVEADQWNEGAVNVTINDCRTGGSGDLFFANGGASAGSAFTRDITVENCTMTQPTAGEAVYVEAPSGVSSPRGPITFVNDTLLCGSSVYVTCIEAKDADINVSSSVVVDPVGTVHEPVFTADVSSGLNFFNDSVSNYATPGTKDGSSTVTIAGGVWSPYLPPRQAPAPVPPTTPTTVPTPTTTTTTTAPTSTAPVAPGTGNSGKTPPSVPVKNTQLTSERKGSSVASIVALDLFATLVALGLLLLLRRRRHPHIEPAVHSVHDLLGRQRRPKSD